jgi:anti-sigma B factor antagonist
MNYSLEEIDGVNVLRLADERLDTKIAPDLKAQLLVLIGDGKKVLLNLENVQYADSSGLGAILLGYRQARDLGGIFAVSNLQKRVQSLVTIAQLDARITIYGDQASALEQMK